MSKSALAGDNMASVIRFSDEAAPQIGAATMHAYLHFNNFDIISSVYGHAAAEAALLDAIAAIEESLGAHGAAGRAYRQAVRITVWDLGFLPDGADLCSYLLLQTAFRLYGDADKSFCFSVTAFGGCQNTNPRRVTMSIPVDVPANSDEALWYHSNMLDAVGILAAISADGLKIVFVPVGGLRDGEASTGYAIDPKIVTEGGALRSIACWRTPFEKLGLIQILDYHVAQAAAAELRADENLRATLYVSPSCLRADTWGKMFGQIFSGPDSAGRFVIGISPSIFFNQTDVDLELIADIRNAGNGIAIDEFDAGARSCHDPFAWDPSNVKMDAA